MTYTNFLHDRGKSTIQIEPFESRQQVCTLYIWKSKNENNIQI